MNDKSLDGLASAYKTGQKHATTANNRIPCAHKELLRGPHKSFVRRRARWADQATGGNTPIALNVGKCGLCSFRTDNAVADVVAGLMKIVECELESRAGRTRAAESLFYEPAQRQYAFGGFWGGLTLRGWLCHGPYVVYREHGRTCYAATSSIWRFESVARSVRRTQETVDKAILIGGGAVSVRGRS
jgi:hypothetical protein